MRARRRSGFTLIELLIVVVIIGILATIAIPKFRNTKGKALAAAIKTDLRNLATAQEAYFYDNASYASDVTQLNMRSSSGVVLTILQGDRGGWSAHATHPAAYPFMCSLFVGSATPIDNATQDGQMSCTDLP